jgi:hypothetical protein
MVMLEDDIVEVWDGVRAVIFFISARWVLSQPLQIPVRKKKSGNEYGTIT